MNETEKGNIAAFIMAGGAGTRFWPLSTRERPKQFMQVFDDRSLLQKSYDRIAGVIPAECVFVLTSDRYTKVVSEQLPDIPTENIIGEPERKDTAAAVCLGALIARKRFDNPVMVVLTADHIIEPVELFRRTLLSAVDRAREEPVLYTFGVRPTFPSSSYGYLEIGRKWADDGGIEHFQVVSFKEKPSSEQARRYLKSGRYLWNSGMFVWTVDAILDELKRYLPEHVARLERAVEDLDGPLWVQSLRSAFAELKRISIDFAVMEKARDVRCVVGEFLWKDVGGWPAFQELLPADDSGNHVRGDAHVLDARDNLLYCDNPEETVVLAGVEHLVIVRAGNRTLVASKDRLEDLKDVVETMTEREK